VSRADWFQFLEVPDLIPCHGNRQDYAAARLGEIKQALGGPATIEAVRDVVLERYRPKEDPLTWKVFSGIATEDEEARFFQRRYPSPQDQDGGRQFRFDGEPPTSMVWLRVDGYKSRNKIRVGDTIVFPRASGFVSSFLSSGNITPPEVAVATRPQSRPSEV